MLFTYQIRPDISLATLNSKLAKEHFELIDSNREFFGEWFGWVDNMNCEQDSLNFINQILKDSSKQSNIFHILYQSKLVGQISLFGIKDNGTNGEIGYWLDQNYNGRGIMNQSIQAILKYGFEDLNLNRIVIGTHVDNLKSQAVAQKLGFTFEGIERESFQLRGEFYSCHVYSMLKSEFKLVR
jgi:ribosomal-protein-serine acetyltransferase